jgi:hypothetical protein
MAQIERVKSAAAPLGSLVKRIRPETQDERAPRLRPEAEIMKRRDDEEYPQQSQPTTYNTLGVQLAQAQLDAKRGKTTVGIPLADGPARIPAMWSPLYPNFWIQRRSAGEEVSSLIEEKKPILVSCREIRCDATCAWRHQNGIVLQQNLPNGFRGHQNGVVLQQNLPNGVWRHQNGIGLQQNLPNGFWRHQNGIGLQQNLPNGVWRHQNGIGLQQNLPNGVWRHQNGTGLQQNLPNGFWRHQNPSVQMELRVVGGNEAPHFAPPLAPRMTLASRLCTSALFLFCKLVLTTQMPSPLRQQ